MGRILHVFDIGLLLVSYSKLWYLIRSVNNFSSAKVT